MLKMKKITESYDMKVFTDSGDYFGDIEEAMLTQTKVYGWRVRATNNSFLSKVLGSAKGVVVPHQLVKAIGDIMLISKTAVPQYAPEDGEEEYFIFFPEVFYTHYKRSRSFRAAGIMAACGLPMPDIWVRFPGGASISPHPPSRTVIPTRV